MAADKKFLANQVLGSAVYKGTRRNAETGDGTAGWRVAEMGGKEGKTP
jgi:hypothetical protein